MAPLDTAPASNAFIIEFMAYSRKIAVKKSKLETYGDMAEYLLKLFLSLGAASSEIHIIFDNYFDDSIKNYERFGRSTSGGKKKVEAIPVTILLEEQLLPAEMKSF